MSVLAPTNAAAAEALNLYQRCRWYELALMRHGFTIERLNQLAHKVANDALRMRGAALGDRYEDLVSRLRIVGLQAAIRYDPEHPQTKYGRNGGAPFASYVADIMDKRVDDFFRSKAEGFGDRRYGNDNRIVLSAMDEDSDLEPDVDLDFEKLMSARRVTTWQQAADAAGWPLPEFVCISVDRAARQVLVSAIADR